jgi:hypothetical protein
MFDARTVTLLLRDLAGGDQGALDRLVPLVYEELRRIAMGSSGASVRAIPCNPRRWSMRSTCG